MEENQFIAQQQIPSQVLQLVIKDCLLLFKSAHSWIIGTNPTHKLDNHTINDILYKYQLHNVQPTVMIRLCLQEINKTNVNQVKICKQIITIVAFENRGCFQKQLLDYGHSINQPIFCRIKFDKLRQLWLSSDNKILSIQTMQRAYFPSLEILHLYHNRIVSLRSLRKWVNPANSSQSLRLQKINLIGNPIVQLDCLSQVDAPELLLIDLQEYNYKQVGNDFSWIFKMQFLKTIGQNNHENTVAHLNRAEISTFIFIFELKCEKRLKYRNYIQKANDANIKLYCKFDSMN